MSRLYFLEQIGDAAVVQYYVDGFEALPLDQKTLVWHLAQAVIAGRDIYYDQRYRHSLDMREVLEQILTHAALVDPLVLTEIRRYTKLFWINSGPHNNLTARKFVLECSRTALREAAHRAARAGATFPIRDGETLDGLLTRLEPPFFDATTDVLVTNKTPGAGRDILEESANNLYSGVAMTDLAGFNERYGLNSRLIKHDGQLVEEICRLGGRYGTAIARIVGHLRDALHVAPPATRRTLEALIRFYESGEEADRAAYDIAWVEDQSAPVDTINGFVENYLDPRSVKGAWEGIVYVVNHDKTVGLRRLAEEAAWFEARMPWDPRWRREAVVGVTARAIDVVMEAGDAGPVTPVGINLPNDQRIRERYGSKSVTLTNINEAYDKSQPESFRREFCWSDDEVARAEAWGAIASEVTTGIHEVLGHGSGRVAEHLDGQPHRALKEHYSALEESRADLVALYFLPEPRIAEIGMVPHADQAAIVRAEYEAYARNALVQLRRVRHGTQIEEDHMRNRQMIVRWLMANSSAIDIRAREGKTFYVCVDVNAFREGCGRLLAQVQRIKSEGDYAAAHELFETYGIHFDADLRDEVVRRVDLLNLPSYTGFVQPKLDAVTDEAGHITDVRISYPCDLERQMLEYSGNGEPTKSAS